MSKGGCHGSWPFFTEGLWIMAFYLALVQWGLVGFGAAWMSWDIVLIGGSNLLQGRCLMVSAAVLSLARFRGGPYGTFYPQIIARKSGDEPLVGVQQPTQNWNGLGESDCLIKTQQCDGWKTVITHCEFCPVL
ncbi:MAG: hypothetical protein EZS28_006853 [Streblomastix strix]|uniref:Uncharacterized protein n=1 Tax=Streblomastix strix TaxID=222440 RepID=A0A5J4WSY7_9EUKA|nr:MAG: hypothetical protein EZS28_006853 [Streblomastix strix]